MRRAISKFWLGQEAACAGLGQESRRLLRHASPESWVWGAHHCPYDTPKGRALWQSRLRAGCPLFVSWNVKCVTQPPGQELAGRLRPARSGDRYAPRRVSRANHSGR